MMVNTRIERFLQKATVPLLKEKLEIFGLSTVGAKAVLRLRLEEEIKKRPEKELEAHFPVNILDSIANNEETVSDSEYQEIITPQVNADNLQQQIDELNDIIKKQEEILELRRKLASLCSNIEVPNAQVFGFRDIEESLPTFSGDDNYSIRQWVRSFEEAKEIHRWNDQQSFIYARRLLKGTAKLFLRSSFCKTWSDLKVSLLEEFHHGVTPADVHNTLRNRRKRKDENIHQYVLAMQEISSLAEIDEEDLINYIIKGIPDSLINKHILFTAKSIPELKQMLKKYEKIKLYEAPVNIPAQSSSTIKQIKKPITSHHSSSNFRGYNCNESGHVITNCPKSRRERGTCYNCGKP